MLFFKIYFITLWRYILYNIIWIISVSELFVHLGHIEFRVCEILNSNRPGLRAVTWVEFICWTSRCRCLDIWYMSHALVILYDDIILYPRIWIFWMVDMLELLEAAILGHKWPHQPPGSASHKLRKVTDLLSSGNPLWVKKGISEIGSCWQ